MKNTAISTFQLFKMFPGQESARIYIEKLRWPTGPVCPFCQEVKRIYTMKKDGIYRCNACLNEFTVRTETIFGRSHIELHKWLYAMYLLVTARKGISSMQLSKEIGVTQKTAWFMLGRIREACGNDISKLSGTIEIDETYIGGKEKNKHEDKKVSGRGTVGKVPVIGMRERGGSTKAFPIDVADVNTVYNAVTDNVEIKSFLNTDEHSGYDRLDGLFYSRQSVNHSEKEYVRGDVHTNGIESVWAVLKRGLNGVYHHASKKHLSRYVNEFTFRLNDGNVKRTSMERLASLLMASIGNRLTWNNLVEVKK